MTYIYIAAAVLSVALFALRLSFFIGPRTAIVVVLLALDILGMALIRPFFPQAGFAPYGVGLGVMVLLVIVFILVWLKDVEQSKGWIHRKK